LIRADWTGGCVVAAPGPSLDLAPLWLTDCRLPTIVVNDAYRRIPNAHVLYACDKKWWDAREGTDFKGEKWSSHGLHKHYQDDKSEAAEAYGLNLVDGHPGAVFMRANGICYGAGGNSGFQAVNLAILFGADPIYLIGFDMRNGTKAHFFGDHPATLGQGDYNQFVPGFVRASKGLDVTILNCTPNSALTCFGYYDPYTLRSMHRDRA